MPPSLSLSWLSHYVQVIKMRGKLNLIAGTEQNCLSVSLLYLVFISAAYDLCMMYLLQVIRRYHHQLTQIVVFPLSSTCQAELVTRLVLFGHQNCSAAGQHNQLIQTAKLFLCFDLGPACCTGLHTTYLDTRQSCDWREPRAVEQYLHFSTADQEGTVNQEIRNLTSPSHSKHLQRITDRCRKGLTGLKSPRSNWPIEGLVIFV